MLFLSSPKILPFEIFYVLCWAGLHSEVQFSVVLWFSVWDRWAFVLVYRTGFCYSFDRHILTRTAHLATVKAILKLELWVFDDTFCAGSLSSLDCKESYKSEKLLGIWWWKSLKQMVVQAAAGGWESLFPLFCKGLAESWDLSVMYIWPRCESGVLPC